ncbi:MAG: hypothetical protein IJS71_03085 [Clostridia bacterium]|nr:hypothetical protein [Clostridia bacterium]
MTGIGQNIIICVLFVISGIVIHNTLKRFNLRVALALFRVLFGLLLFYIPFYFGGNGMLLMSGRIFPDEVFKKSFEYLLSSIITAPFFFMKSVTIVSVIVSLFAILASVIATISIFLNLVELVSSKSQADTRTVKPLFTAESFTASEPSHRYKYKLIEHYLN